MKYKDYTQKPISPDKLAPQTAQPKMTKGDTHRRRFIMSHPEEANMREVVGYKSDKKISLRTDKPI